MASNAPGECCRSGFIHDGTPTGEIKNFAGYETYIVYPENKSTDKVLYFITDILGHKFPNSQLVADSFAKEGYLVVMPDLFNGDNVPFNYDGTNFDFGPWLQKHPAPDVTTIVENVLAQIKSEFKPKKIAAVGYCFGAKYVVQLLGKSSIDSGYGAHPSFVTIEEIAAIKRPFSIAAAQTDSIFTTELRQKTEEKLNEIGATYQINLFAKVSHGFAIRCDVKDPWQKFAKEQAFKQAVEWFEHTL